MTQNTFDSSLKNDTKKIIGVNTALLVFLLVLLIVNAFVFRSLLDDTKKIYLSKNLGMLSQQITKALFTLEAEQRTGLPTQSSLAQISEGVNGFNEDLAGLIVKTALLSKNTSKNKDTLEGVQKIQREWNSWKDDLILVIKNKGTDINEINYALNKLNAKNVYLLSLTDDFALMLENRALESSNLINNLQVFIFVIFSMVVFVFTKNFIKRSNENESEKIHQKMILSSGQESVFLLDLKGKILKNQAHLGSLFLNPVNGSNAFTDLFKTHLSDAQHKELAIYIKYLAHNLVNPVDLKKLNPLNSFQVSQNGAITLLTARFTQIKNNEKIYAIMVKIASPYHSFEQV